MRWTPLLGAERRGLLTELLMLAMNGREHYGSVPNAIELTSVRSRRIWDVLAEAEEMGLAMTRAGRASGRGAGLARAGPADRAGAAAGR